VYFLFAVTKCREDLSLTKNRLANADNTVDFSETAVNSCDDDEQFDDGTNRENIKCTTARGRVGIWSHKEYSCHGKKLQKLFLNLTYIPFLQCDRIARNADRCISQSDSVRLSVCRSVTFRCFVQTNEDTIVRFSALSRKIILVSEEVKFIRIFAGGHPQRGR